MVEAGDSAGAAANEQPMSNAMHRAYAVAKAKSVGCLLSP